MALPLYSASQVRDMDHQLIAAGTPAAELMQRAGAAAWQLLQSLWPDARHLIVLCGPGNNGGDGYVIARLAAESGFQVELVSVGGTDRLQGAALQAKQAAEHAGLTCQKWADFAESWLEDKIEGRIEGGVTGSAAPTSADVVLVDAILGSGARSGLAGDCLDAVVFANRQPNPVLAIDQPTGVDPDTGAVVGQAVRAAATLSFIGRKAGLLTGAAADYCGVLYFDDLGAEALLAGQHVCLQPLAHTLELSDLRGSLMPRRRTDHKGRAGRVVIVGGDCGFGGAAIMAAQTALRAGSGTVTLITRSTHVAPALVRQPEMMVHAVDEVAGQAFGRAEQLLRSASAIVVGPGLGQSDWSDGLLSVVLDAARDAAMPLVLDADALNLMALRGAAAWVDTASSELRRQWVLTPHPGEAARLLEVTPGAVQSNRFAAVQALTRMTGCVSLLKGAGTLIAAPGDPIVEVCTEGNPGMASGGMGDVLAGLLGGLLGQGVNARLATRLAVAVHGEAADRLAGIHGERGLLATDLLPEIRNLLMSLLNTGVK